MVIYPNGTGVCYGCGAKTANNQRSEGPQEEKYVEDIQATLDVISDYPRATIRGLELPYNDLYYYIVWPNAPYYKKRSLNNNDGGSKYKCPSGHVKPLFVCKDTEGTTPLIVIEGELNALSVHLAFPDIAVCSPGGVSDMWSEKSTKWKNYLPFYNKYNRLLVVADCDKAGGSAAIGLAGFLNDPKKVRVKLMAKDANDVLTELGKDALKEEIEKELGHLEVSRRVPSG